MKGLTNEHLIYNSTIEDVHNDSTILVKYFISVPPENFGKRKLFRRIEG